jgi:hypothetical protein
MEIQEKNRMEKMVHDIMLSEECLNALRVVIRDSLKEVFSEKGIIEP